MERDYEEELWEDGYHLVAGIDEVGRGALAGPVMAAAVILPSGINHPWLGLIKDSKELTPKRRESLYRCIREIALAIGIGSISHETIDQRGILVATKMAMIQAIQNLFPMPQFLLIDALQVPFGLPQKAIIRGDKCCLSIACASIVAKVTRDRLMRDWEGLYYGYGFSHHKGYGTPQHFLALKELGPSPIHRLSFKPLKRIAQ